MEFISGRFTKQRKEFLQANDKLYESVELPIKTLGLPLNTEIIRRAHGLLMEDEKDVLAGKYRRSSVFAGYHIFAPAGYIEICLERLPIYLN